MLDQHEKSHLHLTTASLLADAARQAAGNELLFRAVHHVTAALDCIQPAPQRQMFRELSLLAARRAKRSGIIHRRSAISRPPERWATPGRCQTLCLISKRRAASLLWGTERTRELCDAILGCPGGLTEKALAANLLVEVYIRQSDSRLALEAALCWLGILVFRLAATRKMPTATRPGTLLQPHGRRAAKPFAQLSRMDNPETEAVMNLLYSASICASFICPRLHFCCSAA